VTLSPTTHERITKKYFDHLDKHLNNKTLLERKGVWGPLA
jgi:hypothetical protein